MSVEGRYCHQSILPHKYLTKEEMEKLTTARLLAYKKKLLKNSWNDARNFYYRGCIDEEKLQNEKLRYEKAYSDIKEVLSKRENII